MQSKSAPCQSVNLMLKECVADKVRAETMHFPHPKPNLSKIGKLRRQGCKTNTNRGRTAPKYAKWTHKSGQRHQNGAKRALNGGRMAPKATKWSQQIIQRHQSYTKRAPKVSKTKPKADPNHPNGNKMEPK